MLSVWGSLSDWLSNLSWMHYGFMKNALLAVLLITPLFAVLGTAVVSNRMVFFTDVLGHSALTGIAIGTIMGFGEPTVSMMVLAVILAVTITTLKKVTKSSMDTILGVIFAFVVALGIVILSRHGGFIKYTKYLVGDVLSVTGRDINALLLVFIGVFIYWYTMANALMLVSANESLAHSRRINTFFVEISFSVLLALVVMISIRLVGILIINSLLVLPAAASRNISRNARSYTVWAIVISVLSGVTGLILSYYWGTASGATIVLCATAAYVLSMVFGKVLRV